MHEELRCAFLKGQRNGNWKKLARMEKALYRAALSYTMPRRGVGRKIVSESVVNKLLILIKKLLETPSQRIFKRGFERAVWLIRKTAIKSGVLAQKSGLHILAWNCVVVRIRREDRRAGIKQLRC